MIEPFARTAVLAVLRRINVGQLTIHDGAHTYVCGPGGAGPSASITIHDAKAWPMLLHGGTGCVDAYVDGLWDTDDLTTVFRVAARNIGRVDALRKRFGFLGTAGLRVRDAFERNTPERSRKDISAHYDLGNEMFSLMLDPKMMYSCAFFEKPGATLADASDRKLETVCEKLDLGPDDHVVEIGTGWGGFAVYAATTRGCRVTTTTISQEQFDVATKRVVEAGVEHLVECRLDDYREMTGQYDKLVSLEMIEAVGHKDFGTYFAQCSKLLKADGLMLLQAITIDDRSYDISKITRSFIRTYIFPNGCLPSVKVMADNVARRTNMRTIDLEDYTPHYAETLRQWRTNFFSHTDELDALGYDDKFRRLWHGYLSYCEAGFEERHIGLVQMVLAKPQYRIGLHKAQEAQAAKAS
ncbi:MAG: cyclopropane-fatty-acyl-phospholipid synthase [Actinomycetota bacterium]